MSADLWKSEIRDNQPYLAAHWTVEIDSGIELTARSASQSIPNGIAQSGLCMGWRFHVRYQASLIADGKSSIADEHGWIGILAFNFKAPLCIAILGFDYSHRTLKQELHDTKTIAQTRLTAFLNSGSCVKSGMVISKAPFFAGSSSPTHLAK